MLTDKEAQFVRYWEEVRQQESTFTRKLLGGLPMAFLFYLPMPLFIVGVYFFMPEWYTKISNRLPGSMWVIMIAIFIAILFYSFFRMHFKWEMNEQYFMELKHRKNN